MSALPKDDSRHQATLSFRLALRVLAVRLAMVAALGPSPAAVEDEPAAERTYSIPRHRHRRRRAFLPARHES